MDFPNGFDDWHETHYQIVSEITRLRSKDSMPDRLNKVCEAGGTNGLMTHAKELTNEFEKKYESTAWGIDFDWYDTLEQFLQERL